MDYEKKYEDALERARVWKEKNGMPINKQDIIDDIFPELKESEDKRIRKDLIDYFEVCDNTTFAHHRVSDIIAWLEKQGEQKPNFCHHEVDFSNCSEEYCKAYYDGWNNCNQQYAQLEAEQKPAWSEEDDTILHCLEYTVKHYYDNKDTIDKCCSWLNSLKERMKRK